MAEIWKEIRGSTTHQVSNKGRVKNIKTGTMIKPQVNNRSGYYNIRLSINGAEPRTVYIHKLVAEAFLGERPLNYDINHIDGNKLNNDAANLEYCSRSANVRHAYENGLNGYVIPIKIVETNEEFSSINDCARAINGDPELIRQCINSKYGRHTHKGYHFEPIGRDDTGRRSTKVKIKETGEIFDSIRECERAIIGAHTNIVKAAKEGTAYKDLHFELIADKTKPKPNDFLYPHQKQAIERMFNGCILNGGVGSGKSRTSLYYYFSLYGGSKDPDYVPMEDPCDLYVITTAKKRNDCEWEGELAHFLMSTNPEVNYYKNKIVVDSWQNIKKYKDVRDSFFIFDEDKVTGKGAWAKAFLRITKSNRWIILSASPGDNWSDYETVFVANGFFRNRTEFRDEHLIYSRYAKFPKIEGYRNERRLIRLRDKILIDMDFDRHTIPHHEDIYVNYDIGKYKDAMRNRWDPFKNEPVQQAAGLCYVLRRIVNEDESRQVALLELFEEHPKMIVFYNFDYERDILLNLYYGDDVEVAEYSGHAHQPIPDSQKWVYLVQYTAGCEGFNCILTDTIVFYSQNYSYKVMLQASGRIDRLNSPYMHLWYFHLKSRSGIDLAIGKALKQKKQFNETRWINWDTTQTRP